MKFFDKDNRQIPEETLPRLIILTGLNGSGKTRGLKKISSDRKGVYFDYKNFDSKWKSPRLISLSPPRDAPTHHGFMSGLPIPDKYFEYLEVLIKKGL
jgi:hypothetical protein